MKIFIFILDICNNNIFKITDITFYVCSIENIKRNDVS
jgi:hypothetical protein